jgi:hypothetical protein
VEELQEEEQQLVDLPRSFSQIQIPNIRSNCFSLVPLVEELQEEEQHLVELPLAFSQFQNLNIHLNWLLLVEEEVEEAGTEAQMEEEEVGAEAQTPVIPPFHHQKTANRQNSPSRS